MECPNCKKELPADHTGRWCSFCGADRTPNVTWQAPSEVLLKPVKVRWPVFFTVLLLPVALTSVTAALIKEPNQGVSVGIALFGGGGAGIACGIMLALRFAKTATSRVFMSLLLGGTLCLASVFLCFLGCTFSGYQFKIN